SIASSDLTCTASGGTVIIGATTGSFQAQFSATPSATGSFANPRAAGTCAVDPNNNVTETNEGNNACSDTVTVTAADLTATKTNNVSGTVNLGSNWNWTVTIANTGNAAAAFTAGQVILSDNLPDTNISYGATSIVNVVNVTNSGNISCSIVSN